MMGPHVEHYKELSSDGWKSELHGLHHAIGKLMSMTTALHDRLDSVENNLRETRKDLGVQKGRMDTCARRIAAIEKSKQ